MHVRRRGASRSAASGVCPSARSAPRGSPAGCCSSAGGALSLSAAPHVSPCCARGGARSEESRGVLRQRAGTAAVKRAQSFLRAGGSARRHRSGRGSCALCACRSGLSFVRVADECRSSMRLLWVVIRLAKCERGRAAAAARRQRQCTVWYSATPSEAAAGLRRRARDAPRVALRKQRRRAARERRPAPARARATRAEQAAADSGAVPAAPDLRSPRAAACAGPAALVPASHHASPFTLSHLSFSLHIHHQVQPHSLPRAHRNARFACTCRPSVAVSERIPPSSRRQP
jgi:hypothetical protein